MSFLLVVDDNEDLRHVVAQVLRLAGHEVVEAPNGKSALLAVEAREPDLIVLDLWMPEMDGLAVCRALKGNPFRARIPILMLTAQSDLEHKVEGFEAGADDYLAKPFEPVELKVRVQSLLRLVQRESDRNPSSGLPGGRAIEAEIARRVGDSAQVPFAVIYFDLDHFKPFADAFGFAVADATIAATGPALHRALMRANVPNDFAGHIGGDDFIAITSIETAETVAQAASEEFYQAVETILGKEAMARGVFAGYDREGCEREFSLASLASIILRVEPQKYQSLMHLGTRAAELKQQAKAQGAGSVVVDDL
jgi:diguanylate cyclase (GGDEF)-like protein